MSEIDLCEAKDFLKVTHSLDDFSLMSLLDGAEDEALQYMNRTVFAELCENDSNFDSSSATIPASVKVAVLMLLQANYQSSPEDQASLRSVAETLLTPYRCGMGI